GESLLPTDAAEGEQTASDELFLPSSSGVAAADEQLDKPLGKLRELRTAVAAERDDLQQRLLSQEASRSSAEDRLDTASDALATQLVTRFEQGDQAAVQALIDVGDQADPALRASMIATMNDTDRAIIQELDAATRGVDE